ncbi:MAG: phage terminase small subunit P27 family [Pseudomonadota bacterium]
MIRGRKPRAAALRRKDGLAAPEPPCAQPRCPGHLSAVARKEWRRLAGPLHAMGVVTVADRAALAAYRQSYARWVEAEEKLAETPILLKTPSGYVQQSPWLSIADKQLELMNRFMAELGLTPAARTRLALPAAEASPLRPVNIVLTSAIGGSEPAGVGTAADVVEGERCDGEERRAIRAPRRD